MTRADSNNMGSLVQALEHQSTLIGDKTALLQKVRGIWVSLTWSEYFAAVAEVGEGLVELGVGVGDKVVTLLANSTALVCTDVATQSIGAVSVPLVIETRPDEVLRLIAELKPKAIAVQSTTLLDLVLEARSTGLISRDTKVVFVDQFEAPYEIGGDQLHLKVIVDQSSVELFTGDGIRAITVATFPPLGTGRDLVSFSE